MSISHMAVSGYVTLFCELLLPEFVQYSSWHSCAISVKVFLCTLVRILFVHPYITIDATVMWKKLRFISSDRSDFL